ncbi:unnamed protein product [Linum tenue]|uniref:Protein kinase domain-containing protein n=1 Tax=Linum tenue TaxID=586396 RepID=A0AAV0R8K4_9ROSI|nr:unnamed protein product [Linum tenue]
MMVSRIWPVLILGTIWILNLLQPIRSAEVKNCEQVCGGGGGGGRVPYPFGFSSGCPIQLNCSAGEIRIGEFRVQNITPDGVIVAVPAKCNRPLDSLSSLFGSNFAPAWRTSLLLQNCSGVSGGRTGGGGCVIPTSSIQNQLNVSGGCDSRSDNVTCYSAENTGAAVLSYGDVSATRCKFAFTAVALGSGSEDPVVSLELQRAQLEWWLDGSCAENRTGSCSRLADCRDVSLGGGEGSKSGFRCRCREGLVGDGFGRGGCRKASNCNPSKYMSGECGGTTDIERATNGFSDKQRLGTGAYGTVYSGKLHNDECVAIKKIRHRDTDSIDQVMNEIKLLSSVSHPNLVRLLGCCIESGEQILVYEFMPNGTLCQHLQRERGKGLPWPIRLAVATETANAIAYLHSAVNPPIYHRDIKSSNILLDYNFKSKVADFGLSRLGLTENSHVSTAPQGTPGYLDPQYHQYFHLSDKSDVYSFGVVLVEIITGLKVVDFSRPHSEVNLAALAIDRIGRGGVDDIIDPYLEPHRDAWTLSSIHNVAELAFRCLAFHRDMRPSMTEVAQELENIRLSAWIVPDVYLGSPGRSSTSSGDDEDDGRSEKSLATKKASIESKRLFVPEEEGVKDSSPVSVQDPWFSEQSSPSSNSLLGNAQ